MAGYGGPVLGTVLGIIGTYYGGPALGALGFAVGNLVGNILFPPPPPDAPPLGDLGVNTYVRSSPVPIVYGINRVYGGIIWIGENYVEMDNEGSSKTPSYAAVYYADFAMVVSEGTIYSYDKIYINDKDISELTDDDAISLSFNYYYGTGVQSPDSLINNFLSSSGDYAPAFIYSAYLVGSGKIGRQNTLPTLSCDIKGLCCSSGIEPTPIVVLYDFLTNTRYGCGIDPSLIDGSPTTSGTWKTEQDFCIESILGNEGWESRFLYSNVFNAKAKAYDIINDILQTCRGFLYYSEGLLKVKIGKNNEEPVIHFAENLEKSLTTGSSCTLTRIYANFSEYMANFWKGDHGEIEILGAKNHFIIVSQTSTYIDLADNLSSIPTSSISFTIYKDNIKKDSFHFQRREEAEINNRIKLEFLNRDDDYRIDYIELDDTYNINNTGEIREQVYSIHGIKRKTQAVRTTSFYLDCATIIEYFCDFETDILGYFLTNSSIVTVTHSSCNFVTKYFRIVGMEELEDFSVKLNLVEYVAGCYHDSIHPEYFVTESYKLGNVYTKPQQIERFMIFEDSITNTLKFGFKRADDDPYWIGINLFILNPLTSSYDFVIFHSKTSPSVKLDSSIDENDTDIYYDPSTMYSSFPESGSFFIEEEEIFYSSIDDITDKFENCTRGYNSTVAVSHTDSQYCVYKSFNMPSFDYLNSQIGDTLTFKAVSINVVGVVADPVAAPTDTIVIGGLSLFPPAPANLQINGQGNDTTLVASNDALLTWLLITTGINKGYGYKYGYDQGYGGGTIEGVYYYKIEVYETSGMTLLRTENIYDILGEYVIGGLSDNLCVGGTATSDSYYSGDYVPDKAFDDNEGTFWSPSSITGDHWIQYQFTEAETVNKLVMQAQNDYNPGFEEFTLYASDTGTFGGEEVELFSVSGLTWTSLEAKEWEFDNENSYVYYRIVGSISGGSYTLSVFELSMFNNISSYWIGGAQYNYTSVYNIADNGSYEENLTFKVYQVNNLNLSSNAITLITNT